MSIHPRLSTIMTTPRCAIATHPVEDVHVRQEDAHAHQVDISLPRATSRLFRSIDIRCTTSGHLSLLPGGSTCSILPANPADWCRSQVMAGPLTVSSSFPYLLPHEAPLHRVVMLIDESFDGWTAGVIPPCHPTVSTLTINGVCRGLEGKPQVAPASCSQWYRLHQCSTTTGQESDQESRRKCSKRNSPCWVCRWSIQKV